MLQEKRAVKDSGSLMSISAGSHTLNGFHGINPSESTSLEELPVKGEGVL